MRAPAVLATVALSLLVAGCNDDADPASAVTTEAIPAVAAGPVAATELVAGDCVTGLVIGENERSRIESASVVGCDQPHELEVFAIFELTPEDVETEDDSYPGQPRVVSAADAGCITRSDELGEVAESIGVIAVWPTQQSWLAGDRAVACAAYSISGGPVADDLRPGG